jgi:hypothetical protein
LVLGSPSPGLRAGVDADERHLAKEPNMSILIRSVAGLAVAAGSLLAAAGVYTESHHVPDQP